MPRRHAVVVAAVAVLHGDHHVPRLHRRVLRPRDGGDLPLRPSTINNALGQKSGSGTLEGQMKRTPPRRCQSAGLHACFGGILRRVI